MYTAFGLLAPDSDFTMAEAAKRLAAKFPSYAVEQKPGSIVVAAAAWENARDAERGTGESLKNRRVIAGHIGGAPGRQGHRCLRPARRIGQRHARPGNGAFQRLLAGDRGAPVLPRG